MVYGLIDFLFRAGVADWQFCIDMAGSLQHALQRRIYVMQRLLNVDVSTQSERKIINTFVCCTQWGQVASLLGETGGRV